MATYSSILSTAQSTLWAAISGNAIIIASTAKVVDGLPVQLLKGTGFPFIIVHTPSSPENFKSFRKRSGQVAFSIEIWDKKELISRVLADAVRNAVYTDVTMNAAGFVLRDMQVQAVNMSVQEDSSVIYTTIINVTYEWFET
jgi:hypothetical protein